MHQENMPNSNSHRQNISQHANARGAEHKAALEASVTKVWLEGLGLPSVGLEDNFFEMGGTSLLATVLLTKLNQTFKSDLPIATIFEYPTVRSLAKLLSANDDSDST